TLAMLPRVSDNLSFLYADIVKVVQTDTGVCAETETESPAHAGMDRIDTTASRVWLREPRARGDGPHLWRSPRPWTTRAPRTRGWTGRVHGPRPKHHESPAHAGMDRRGHTGQHDPAREPRARGDGPKHRGLRHPFLTRAPRTRGWTETSRSEAPISHESPAHAGMGRTGVTEDALLIIGEITTNAL